MAAPKKKAVAGKPAKKAVKPAKPVKKAAPAAWQDILDTLLANPGLTRRSMFGADAIGLGGKYFAMCWDGQLVAKLSRDRVDALVADGVGRHFDPSGMGKPMREWLVVAPGRDWSRLVEEALAHSALQQR